MTIEYLNYKIGTSLKSTRCRAFHKITGMASPIFDSKKTIEHSIEQAKDWIRSRKCERQDWTGVKSLGLNFNADFSQEFIGDDSNFYIGFERDADGIYLRFSKQKRPIMPFKSSNKSTKGKPTMCSHASMPVVEGQNFKLSPHARYILEETSIPGKFLVIFDSLVADYSDKIRLGLPGFATSATHRKTA